MLSLVDINLPSTFHPLEALGYLQDFYAKCITAFQKYIDGDLCSSYPSFMKQSQQEQLEMDELNSQDDPVTYAASNMV